jgi:hypothetical protein
MSINDGTTSPHDPDPPSERLRLGSAALRLHKSGRTSLTLRSGAAGTAGQRNRAIDGFREQVLAWLIESAELRNAAEDPAAALLQLDIEALVGHALRTLMPTLARSTGRALAQSDVLPARPAPPARTWRLRPDPLGHLTQLRRGHAIWANRMIAHREQQNSEQQAIVKERDIIRAAARACDAAAAVTAVLASIVWPTSDVDQERPQSSCLWRQDGCSVDIVFGTLPPGAVWQSDYEGDRPVGLIRSRPDKAEAVGHTRQYHLAALHVIARAAFALLPPGTLLHWKSDLQRQQVSSAVIRESEFTADEAALAASLEGGMPMTPPWLTWHFDRSY